MNTVLKWLLALLSAMSIGTVLVLACGAPPPSTPPPPPPDPPAVCCQLIARFPNPSDPTRQIFIIRYFRQDGRPLYQSNPMPLLPTQKCLCVLPNLPTHAIAAGVIQRRISFSPQPIWQGLPPNVPGYGPFNEDPSLSLLSQSLQFFNSYSAAAAGTVTPPDNPVPITLWSFQGPGTIPANSFFDIFVQLEAPIGFDPGTLCIPGQMWMIGLFLVNGTQVLAEPIQPGLAPVPFAQFTLNPGQSAFYKFKWYPVIIPPLCPPTCVADVDDGSGTGTPDGGVTIDDLLYYLFRFDFGC